MDDDSGFDEAFDSILAGLGSPAAEAAATEVAAPVDADSPTEETEAVEDGSTDEPEAEQTVAESPALPETPVAAAPPEIDWTRPELKPVLERAMRMEALERSLAEAKRVQANEQIKQDLTDLADGDPERHQKVTGLIAQVAEPLRRQAQQHEHVATQTAQTAAALHIAIRSVVPEALQEQVFAEAKHLTQYQDANVMERMAFGKRDAAKAYSEREQGHLNRIAELERQLSASQSITERQASGADLVDGGGGSAPLDLQSRLNQAESLDDVFDLMGIGTGRRTA